VTDSLYHPSLEREKSFTVGITQIVGYLTSICATACGYRRHPQMTTGKAAVMASAMVGHCVSC